MTGDSDRGADGAAAVEAVAVAVEGDSARATQPEVRAEERADAVEDDADER